MIIDDDDDDINYTADVTAYCNTDLLLTHMNCRCYTVP